MGRTVIVGDIHGCAAELQDLLEHVGLTAGDRLVLVGDLVARGPESKRVVELAREYRALSVRGNHEDRLLRWYESRRSGQTPQSLSSVHRRVAEELEIEDWAFLRSLPLYLQLPSHDLLVVHAGMMPGRGLLQQHPRTLLTIRTLSQKGEASSAAGENVWGQYYQGPPHVAFGHFARQTAQLHPWATGLDTSCVYGCRLTALVLNEGEAVAPASERADQLRSVPARRAWFP